MTSFKQYKTELDEAAGNSTIFIVDLATGKASITKDVAKAFRAINIDHTFAINVDEGIQYMKNGNDKKIGKYPFYVMNMFSKKAKGVRSKFAAENDVKFSDGETYAIDVNRRVLIKPTKR